MTYELFKSSTPILGTTQASVPQAQEWARNRGAASKFILIAPIYWHIGRLIGIRPEVAYAQSAKETAFGRYGGVVSPEMNNWAGIKTREGGANEDINAHESFDTPEKGVIAHFNHLAAYTGVDPIGEPHGRYYLVKRISWAGTVKYVEELGGKWAPSQIYGESIVSDYLRGLLNTKLPEDYYDDDLVEPATGLTVEEQEVMDDILNTWDKYLKLEKQHPEEVKEFGYAVHLMQGLLAMRVVRRDYPDGWINFKDI